jgi:hypothetical protein
MTYQHCHYVHIIVKNVLNRTYRETPVSYLQQVHYLNIKRPYFLLCGEVCKDLLGKNAPCFRHPIIEGYSSGSSL